MPDNAELERKIEALREDIDRRFDKLINSIDRSNDRIETYQKASQQVVNLAFGLILTAVIAIVVPAIFSSR